MTFWQMSEKVLAHANQAMTTREILQQAINSGLIVTKGKTPLATLRATLYTRSNRDPRLERVFEQGSTRAKRGSVRWRLRRQPRASK